MKYIKRSLAVAALLCLLPLHMHAQNTTVTASALKMKLVPIPTGLVTFTPVDASSRAVPFQSSGLNSPQAFACSIANGALSGCSVPDLCIATPANLKYQISISSSGYQYTLFQVANVCGTSWPLDAYVPPATTSSYAPISAGYGTAVPTGACPNAAEYVRNGNGGELYICVAAAWVKVTGGGGGGAAITGIRYGNGSGSDTAANSAQVQAAIGSGVYDASGAAAAAQSAAQAYAANASNIASGTLNHARLPTLQSADIPNNAASTSGNAGTATALAGTPSKCADGNAPTGVDAGGNAEGCQPSIPNFAALYGFGTSIVHGSGATSIPQHSMFSMLAGMTTASSFNYGIAGYYVGQMGLGSELPLYAPSYTQPQMIYLEAGENDTGTCSSAACHTNYTNQYDFMDSWVAIPPQFKILASNATLSGVWTNNDYAITGVYQPALTSSPGDIKLTSANGATATYSIPSSASPVVGLSWLVTNGATGTFTVSVDGTPVVDNCSGTTTFSTAPCSAIFGYSTSSIYRQDWPVTPGGTHTVLVTNTSTQNLTLIGADWIPPSSIVNMPVVFHGSSLQSFSPFAVLNPLAQAVATKLKGYGLKVYWVDYTTGTPGVNATTDVSTSATVSCPASAFTSHPNDCGYLHMLQTVQNVAAANQVNIGRLNQGGSSIATTGAFSGPVQGYGATSGSDRWSVLGASGAPPSGVLTYWQGSYDMGHGVMLDTSSGAPWSGQFLTMTFNDAALNSWNCQGYHNHNTSLDDPAQFVITSCVSSNSGAQAGPAVAPSGACTMTGAWIFSRDGHATFCNGSTWVSKI